MIWIRTRRWISSDDLALFLLLVATIAAVDGGQNAAAHHEVKSEIRTCTNKYGDSGFCVESLTCWERKGLVIGVCHLPPPLKQNETTDVQNATTSTVGMTGGACCFLDLPCTRTMPDTKTLLEISKYGIRNIGSAGDTTASPPLTKQHEPRPPPPPLPCGPFVNGSKVVARRPQGLTLTLQQKSKMTPSSPPWLLSLWVRFESNKEGDGSKTNSMAVCGATPVTSRFAMTAAHCTIRSDQTYFVRGATGINKDGFGIVRDVVEVVTHPDFDIRTFENDIAILRLKQALPFGARLHPPCLPAPMANKSPASYAGETAIMAGWGCLRESCLEGEVPVTVRWSLLPVITNELGMCWFLHNSSSPVAVGRAEYLPEMVFLVGGVDESGGGSDSSPCRGDSGSPIVRPMVGDDGFEVIGLVSWSKGCGMMPFRPSVWTRVEAFVGWIEGVVVVGGGGGAGSEKGSVDDF